MIKRAPPNDLPRSPDSWAVASALLTRRRRGGEKKQAERELASYQAKVRLKSDGDPFEWWRSRYTSYPLLSR